MKTTITTKRGAKVEVSFNPEIEKFSIKVAGHNFNTDHIQVVGGIAKFRDGKQPVHLPMDKKNIEIFQNFLNEIKEMKQKKKEAAYDHLKSQFSPVSEVVIAKEGDDEKVKQLLEKARRQPVFSGAESEGLNIASESENSRLRISAMQNCNHDLTVSYDYGYTSYGTKQLTRKIDCCKCGMALRETKQDISTSALWR